MRQVIPGYDLTLHEAMLHHEDRWDDDDFGPRLSDEVDEQMWLSSILLTDASKLGESNTQPVLTCTSTHGKRSFPSTKWGDEELKAMSAESSPTITAMLSHPYLPFPDAPCHFAWDMLPSPPDPGTARMTDPWTFRGDRQPPAASPTKAAANAADHAEDPSAPVGSDTPETQDDKAPAESEPPPPKSGGEEEFSQDPEILQQEDDDRAAYERALRSTPEHWAELTDEKTADVVDSSQVDGAAGEIGCGDMPSRDDIVRTKGVKTRVQLTFREDGGYVSKASLGLDDSCPTNWVLQGIPGDAVKALVEPLASELRRRHKHDVAAGRARKRGGPSVRIQMTEYTAEGGEYVKQGDGAERRRTLNETCPGATLVLVSFLLDYLFAANFGERSRNAAELVRFYREWIEEGVRKPDADLTLGDPGRGSDDKPENSPNTVQPSPAAMRRQVAEFLTSQNIKILDDLLGADKLDRVWEMSDGYGRTGIDDLRSADVDRDVAHILESTDGALESVFKQLQEHLKQATGARDPRHALPAVELVRPDLVSVQWNRETHLGYWCLVHGDFCIVRSVHRSEQAALAASPTLKGSGWELVDPEGCVVAFEGPEGKEVLA